jgi:RNA polymerase sigma-70 factor (ECF subfamily)
MLGRRLARHRRPAIARARADADAFTEFYAGYIDRVVVYFTRRVLNAEVAFELAAETFALAFERRTQFRGATAEEEQGWLFAIAHSQLTRYWRRGSVERAALRRLAVDIPSMTDAEIDRVETLAGLRDLAPIVAGALHDLPADQRRAVELRVLDELDYRDIAIALSVSEQVARARVSRGLRAMGKKVVGCVP